jgi:hypothetical protein
VSTLNVITSNTVTGNVSTLGVLTANVYTLNVNRSNTLTGNVSTLGVLSANVSNTVTANLIVNGDTTVTGNVFSALGKLGEGGGFTLTLPADIAVELAYTGPVRTSNPLSIGLSNGFTITGTSTLISVSANGNFQFSKAGPYILTAVFKGDQNITGLAVGSNVADIHGSDQTYMYDYTTFITQNPTEFIQIPINVTNTALYYYLDLTTINATLLHQTNAAGGGTYLTIAPHTGGGLATGGPGGTPGTQWVSSGSNIYFSNSVGIGPINPQYNLDVLGNVHANSFVCNVITGRTTAYIATASDHYIGLSSGRSITLPVGSSCPVGKTFIIKDESSNASINNISLSTTGGDLIDGQSIVTLALNNISLTTLWTGTRWSLI